MLYIYRIQFCCDEMSFCLQMWLTIFKQSYIGASGNEGSITKETAKTMACLPWQKCLSVPFQSFGK